MSVCCLFQLYFVQIHSFFPPAVIFWIFFPAQTVWPQEAKSLKARFHITHMFSHNPSMSVLLPPLIVQDLLDCFHQLYPLVVKVYSALFPPWIKMSFLLSYIHFLICYPQLSDFSAQDPQDSLHWICFAVEKVLFLLPPYKPSVEMAKAGWSCLLYTSDAADD